MFLAHWGTREIDNLKGGRRKPRLSGHVQQLVNPVGSTAAALAAGGRESCRVGAAAPG